MRRITKTGKDIIQHMTEVIGSKHMPALLKEYEQKGPKGLAKMYRVFLWEFINGHVNENSNTEREKLKRSLAAYKAAVIEDHLNEIQKLKKKHWFLNFFGCFNAMKKRVSNLELQLEKQNKEKNV